MPPLDLPVPGSNDGTWDEKLNAALTQLDTEKASTAALAGKLDVSVASSTYAPKVGAFQEVQGRIATAVQDVNILCVSDSTGAMSGGWVEGFAAALAARYPAWTVRLFKWNGTAYPGTPNFTYGSGTRVLTVYGAAAAGQTWQYFTDATRREALLRPADPDLVIVANGHNENTTQAQSGTASNLAQLRDKAVAHLETIRTISPGAAFVLTSQNPLTANNIASQTRADIYRRIARQRGYGFVDVTRAFDTAAEPLSSLVDADGIHPTPAGFTVWVAELMKQWGASGDSQFIPALPPSLSLTPKNLLTNGDFANFPSPPTLPNWTANNATLSQDTTRFETGTYSLLATKTTGGSSSSIEAPLPIALVAGRTVTVAVRMLVPAGVTGNAGQLAVFAPTSTQLASGTVWTVNDQFFWRSITVRIPGGAASAKVRILVDPTTGASASLVIDRVSVTFGDYPHDLP